jgi:hypothetical protein
LTRATWPAAIQSKSMRNVGHLRLHRRTEVWLEVRLDKRRSVSPLGLGEFYEPGSSQKLEDFRAKPASIRGSNM